jgi:uncharacterized BrkB/YihY/UPF0761 family membrane protein
LKTALQDSLAARLACYFLLALFPALLFLVSLLAYLPVCAALDAALAQLEALLPDDVLSVVRAQATTCSAAGAAAC